jgi:RNA polymerase sigma-70 factor (ECF subfamily)
VILRAGCPGSPQYQEAIETLCRAYWFPLYAFLRRRGHNASDAEDCVQAFFTRMLEREYLRGVDPKPGKFRSFILTALKRFLANERQRAGAVKRGGRHTFISFDAADAEHRYHLEPTHDLSADKLFEKAWALAVLERTMERLERELAADGKQMLFDHLKVYLGQEGESRPYRETAALLDMTENAVKMAVSRLRSRYRILLRDEVAQTVAAHDDVEEEIRDLLSALCY